METVTVASKIPGGLVLELDGDSRKFTLKGNRQLTNDAGIAVNPHDIEAGAGLTSIPRDFWEKWLAAHKDYEPVKNRLIFAAPTKQEATQEAVIMESEKSGLDPLDPDKVEKTHGVEEEEDAKKRPKKRA